MAAKTPNDVGGGPLYTSPIASNTDSQFKARTTTPDKANPYYIKSGYSYGGVKGYNPAILGNSKYRMSPASVLPNCVGYATGRFNEIGGYKKCKYLGAANATDFTRYTTDKMPLEKTPSLGACMVWGGGKGHSCGHVAIVEKIISSTKIVTSESGWSATKPFWTKTREKGDGNWGQSKYYKFKGFIRNPAVTFSSLADRITTSTSSGAASGALSQSSTASSSVALDYNSNDYWSFGTPPPAVDSSSIIAAAQGAATGALPSVAEAQKNVIGAVSQVRGTNLLTTPTLVESPFIQVTIGKYTFGSYTKSGSQENEYAIRKVTYPNYMESLRIVKINGAVNQYTLVMKYQIQAGDDPNLIDRILSSVADTRKIRLTYGDWNSPSFMYRDEDALITKVISNVDFQSSCITYTIYCTSTALSLKSKVHNFPALPNTKPSEAIKGLLDNKAYGLLDLFYGMKTDLPKAKSMIASDDKPVDIKAQKDKDVISYLNYLVSCMVSDTNGNSTIQNSMYNLVLKDDISGELAGPYFMVVKTDASSKVLSSASMYEVDIGYPGQTIVTDFRLNNDNSWSILYKYAESTDQDNYVYRIDNKGNLYTEYSPSITTSDKFRQTTEANKTWWTRMTQFPITATLTIKGLLRPAMLMENVKINAFFYGQRHISSGLYVITRQEDEIGKGGYKTTLTLTRIAGDEDVLYSTEQTIVSSGGSSPGSSLPSAAGAAVGLSALLQSQSNGYTGAQLGGGYTGGKIGGN